MFLKGTRKHYPRFCQDQLTNNK